MRTDRLQNLYTISRLPVSTRANGICRPLRQGWPPLTPGIHAAGDCSEKYSGLLKKKHRKPSAHFSDARNKKPSLTRWVFFDDDVVTTCPASQSVWPNVWPNWTTTAHKEKRATDRDL